MAPFFFFFFTDDEQHDRKKFDLEDSICRIILRFLQLKSEGLRVDLGFGLEQIKSVSFNGVELSYIGDIRKVDISKISSEEASKACFNAGYRQIFHCKTDITINGHNILIRSQNNTDRPLINHSTRDKYLDACQKEGLSIRPLDKMVEDYWQKRSLGIINEDISNLDALSPFREHKDYLKPILTRLFFEGVKPKEGLSADIFLDYEGEEPWNTKTWHPYSRENYIDYVWDHLRFSFRADRGMPSKYNPSDDKYKMIRPWAYEWKNKKGETVYKGALHIRVINFDSDNPAVPEFIVKNAEVIKKIKANRGEIDEMIIKIFLVEAREKKLYLPIVDKPELITSVGMRHNKTNQIYEFSNLPFYGDWSSMPVEELLAISQYSKIQKASQFHKADVIVNNIGISLKSQRGASPSIINTTMRSKIKKVMDSLHQPMKNLDLMINNYWSLRLARKIGEDISNSDPNSPFLKLEEEDGKKILEPLLTYFSFDGTGSRLSKSPADYILEFDNPVDVTTWTCYSRDNYICSVFLRLVFSVRNHNMPSPNAEDLPWVKEIDGNKKGQLNVRVAKR